MGRDVSMSYRVIDLEGVGAVFAEKLAAAGISTTEQMLAECGAAKGRKSVAEKTGIGEGKLLTWVNMADLMRISGIGAEFSELLEAAGVDTVRELQHRNAENLAATMVEVNEQRKLTRRVPSAGEVAKWIEQAKTLPPMVSH